MQYQFEILRKMSPFLSSIMTFNLAVPQELVTMVTMNDMSSIISKDTVDGCLKMT